MNTLLEKIRREWERNLLVFLSASLACLGGWLAYGYLNREEEPEERAKGRPELPAFFDVALLTVHPVQMIPEDVNPMACRMTKPPKPPKPPRIFPPVKQEPGKPPVKQEPVKPPVKPPVKQEPVKPPVKQEPVKPPVKPKPPKPKRKRKFEIVYVGNMSISGGNSGAQLRVSELLSAKQRSSHTIRLKQGEKLYDGLMTVVEYDKNRVILGYSGGKQCMVPIRAKKRVLEIEVDD